MIRPLNALGAVALAGAVAALTLVPASGAMAAGGNLEVSSDGVSYGKTVSGALFDQLALIVPGDVQTESLFLRNSGDEAGYLRIVLEDVVYSDLDFANALTLQTTVGATSGARTPVSMAQPCWVVHEGTVVPAGGVVRLDTDLVLGNLDGKLGQGATATMSFSAALSDTTPGSVSPAVCNDGDVSVPVLPGTPPRAGASTGSPNNSDVAVTVPESDDGGSNDLPVLNLPGGIVIDPNTWDLDEELLVLFLFGALIVGGSWFFLVGRRRRRGDEPAVATDVGVE